MSYYLIIETNKEVEIPGKSRVALPLGEACAFDGFGSQVAAWGGGLIQTAAAAN